MKHAASFVLLDHLLRDDLINLLLLMCVAVIPFAARLIATYLKQTSGHGLAAAVYAGTFLITTIVFATLNWHILFRKTHLLRVDLTFERRREIISRGLTGIAPYAIATAIAPVSPYATLIICGAIAVFYALPVAAGGAAD